MSEPLSTSSCIRQRQTLKVLADVDRPWPPPDPQFKSVMVELMHLAACAPFQGEVGLRNCRFNPFHQRVFFTAG
jgi:hypothetical protein